MIDFEELASAVALISQASEQEVLEKHSDLEDQISETDCNQVLGALT